METPVPSTAATGPDMETPPEAATAATPGGAPTKPPGERSTPSSPPNLIPAPGPAPAPPSPAASAGFGSPDSNMPSPGFGTPTPSPTLVADHVADQVRRAAQEGGSTDEIGREVLTEVRPRVQGGPREGRASPSFPPTSYSLPGTLQIVWMMGIIESWIATLRIQVNARLDALEQRAREREARQAGGQPED